VGVKKEKSSSVLLYERRTNGLSKMTSSPFEKEFALSAANEESEKDF
jgi:hypothetical protein